MYSKVKWTCRVLSAKYQKYKSPASASKSGFSATSQYWIHMYNSEMFDKQCIVVADEDLLNVSAQSANLALQSLRQYFPLKCTMPSVGWLSEIFTKHSHSPFVRSPPKTRRDPPISVNMKCPAVAGDNLPASPPPPHQDCLLCFVEMWKCKSNSRLMWTTCATWSCF